MLKSIARRPELVDPYDTDAPDPFTLSSSSRTRAMVAEALLT
jgi:hypothetical protein